MRTLFLTDTGEEKTTGYGVLPVLQADGPRPERSRFDMGITSLDCKPAGYVPGGMVWILGGDWEAMVNCELGRPLSFSGLCGGVQDRKAVLA